MSQLSTKFAQTVSALSLATAALVVPFNSVAQTARVDPNANSELATHPLANIPGMSFAFLMNNEIVKTVGQRMQDQAAGAPATALARSRAQTIAAVLGDDIIRYARIDNSLSPKVKDGRKSGAYIYGGGICNPDKPEDVAKDPQCTKLDIRYAAVIPAVGQEYERVPVCIEQASFDLRAEKGKQFGARSIIYTILADPASGNLLPLNWQGNSVEVGDTASGKFRAACLDFAISGLYKIIYHKTKPSIFMV